jgi:hypothetical protein
MRPEVGAYPMSWRQLGRWLVGGAVLLLIFELWLASCAAISIDHEAVGLVSGHSAAAHHESDPEPHSHLSHLLGGCLAAIVTAMALLLGPKWRGVLAFLRPRSGPGPRLPAACLFVRLTPVQSGVVLRV